MANKWVYFPWYNNDDNLLTDWLYMYVLFIFLFLIHCAVESKMLISFWWMVFISSPFGFSVLKIHYFEISGENVLCCFTIIFVWWFLNEQPVNTDRFLSVVSLYCWQPVNIRRVVQTQEEVQKETEKQNKNKLKC